MQTLCEFSVCQPASLAVHLDHLMAQPPSTEENQKHGVGCGPVSRLRS